MTTIKASPLTCYLFQFMNSPHQPAPSKEHLDSSAKKEKQSDQTTLQANDTVLFFDGSCGMCHQFVQTTLQHDDEELFKFAPLQGKYAADKLPETIRNNQSSITILHNGNILTRSEAVNFILQHTKHLPFLRCLLFIAPRWLADLGYRIVARYRHQLSRRPKQCDVIPESILNSRFLD